MTLHLKLDYGSPRLKTQEIESASVSNHPKDISKLISYLNSVSL